MRRASNSSSSSGSKSRAAQASEVSEQTTAGSRSTVARSSTKPKVITRRPQRTQSVMREVQTVARSATPETSGGRHQVTTDRLDELDQILAALEDRVMRALERRGGIHRGWF